MLPNPHAIRAYITREGLHQPRMILVIETDLLTNPQQGRPIPLSGSHPKAIIKGLLRHHITANL